jgi:anti-sigma factor RsiW
MSCESWQEAILDRVAGEASEEQAIAVEQHLAECAACAAEAQRLTRLLRAAAPREECAADAGMEERLAEEMRRRAAPPPLAGWTVLWRWRVPAYAVLAVALLGVAVGTRVGRRPVPASAGWTEPAPSLASSESAPVIRFATTPSDAIAAPRLSSPDSL